MADTVPDHIEQTHDPRNPDALRRRNIDAAGLLREGTVTPELLAKSCFQTTLPDQPPGYHVDADRQAQENGEAKTVARGDHSHDLTYLRVGEDRTKGSDDADYVQPYSNPVVGIAQPFDKINRRIVTWEWDPNYPVPSVPIIVEARYTIDAGVTYTDWERVGFVPPRQDGLIYEADARYVFDETTVIDQYRLRLPGYDRTAAGKLARTGTDGKLDVGFMPTTVLTDAETPHGDSNATIVASDRVMRLSAALTAPRVWSLPAAATVAAGRIIWILDGVGGVSAANTLTIQRSSTDTIDGATTLVLANPYDGAALESDGASKWTYVVLGVEQGGTGSKTASGARANLGLGSAAVLASDTDGTLAANSDANVATQKATKTYVDAEAAARAAADTALGARALTTVEPSKSQRTLIPDLSPSTPFLLVAGDAYFIYLGRAVVAFTPQFVEFLVTTAGSITQVAEVGFYSTPLPPNKSAQTLTKIVATGTVDAMTGTGVKRNTAAFATSVPAGTHLWAAIRVNLSVGQPTLLGIANDLEQGQILLAAGSAALTTGTTRAGAVVGAALVVGANCPYLSGVLD